MAATALIVRYFGICDYAPLVAAMREYSEQRDANAPDEFWLLQHPPVFTLGRAGDESHVLDPGTIPLVRTDRGGQVTYHGPGQLVVYVLVDLQRRGIGVRTLVHEIEEAMIVTLARYDIAAARVPGAPGVYVDGSKIGALGLRVRRGCSYHGLSLNVAMDLAPFACINPCGYSGLAVTQMLDLLPAQGRGRPEELLSQTAAHLVTELASRLGYNELLHRDGLDT
ncbi:MAG: lipoyl(octanoyl) transferase LipB [Gammaproteobacteria bacterium]|nr:lipoyl(octanoyl) transferase LipB [Gammaproteobacteria bacterium]